MILSSSQSALNIELGMLEFRVKVFHVDDLTFNEAKEFVKGLCQNILLEADKGEVSNFAQKTVHLLGARFLHLYHLVMDEGLSNSSSLAELEQVVNNLNLQTVLTTHVALDEISSSVQQVSRFQEIV